MKKPIVYLLPLAMFALASTMCSENKSDGGTYKPPPEEVIPPESGLWASFESKFNRYAKGQQHPGQSNAAKIRTKWADTMWINDRTHAQIVVWTNDEAQTGLSFEVSDLESGGNIIAKSNVKLRYCSYIIGDSEPLACNNPGRSTPVYVADALSTTPVNSVAIEDPIKIWLTVNTPKTTAAGKYTGTVKVKQGGEVIRTLDIEMLVVNKTLPDVADWTFHLDIWQFPFQLMQQCSPRVEFASAGYFTLMEPFYKMLADAGQKTISTYIKDGAFNSGDQTMVKWTKKANGSWEFDYTRFDAFVTKMMEWGITKQISCFSLAGWNLGVPYYDEATSSNKTQAFEGTSGTGASPKVGSPEYKALWNAFLTDFKAHLDTKGWFSKTVLYMDEIAHADMEAIINLIREHNINWKIGLAGSNLGDLEDYMYDYSVFLTRESKQTTAVKTFYTSCSHLYPNNYVTPLSSPGEMAWMGWHAAGNGYNGYLRWAYDYWRTGNPLDVRDSGATAGDCNMVYYLNGTLNSNNVVAAARMELMREGVQDYEKIRILNNAELNAFAATVTVASGQRATYYVDRGEGIIARVSAQ